MNSIPTILLLLISLGAIVPAGLALQPGVNYSSATELEPGSYTFNLQAGETHFFKVELEKGETLLVTMRVPRGVDFDIVLASPERDTIDVGIRAAGLTERLAYTATSSGPHYLIIFPFGRVEGSYNLIISILKRPEVTVTKTVTETAYYTVTEYEEREVTITVTSEFVRTTTVSQEDPQIPWSTLGLVTIAVALVASAITLRDGLKTFRSKLAPSGAEQERGPGEG